MPSIQQSKSAIMKYDPVWRKLPERKVSKNTNCTRAMNQATTTDSLLRLNEVAKGYPFCIMYHTKEHDPL